MNIMFHSNQLSLRGTEVALYDYAKYNEELLNNNSFIITRHPEIYKYSHPLAIEKFKKKFSTFFYKNFNDVEKILDDNKIDIFYNMDGGVKNNTFSRGRKSIVHCVFNYYEPYGDVYAYISEWLGRINHSPFVPYIVNLPEINDNLRNELQIPKNSIVFGRHGGAETFDIAFVHNVVKKIAIERKDIYFLFLYTNKFSDDSIKNIIYLEGTEDLILKTKFINTCDAMLHARYAGESFGLSIGEFSIRNKPIITLLNGSRDCAHIEMLGNKGIYYNNENELYNILNNFKSDNSKDWNAYRNYNPENVMNKFKQIFLS